jgi:hypothetical protein
LKTYPVASFRTGARVTQTGVVTIDNGGQLYDLHIAGATVGEAGFAFGAGGILTFSGGAKAAPVSSENSNPQPETWVVSSAVGIGPGIAMTHDQLRPASGEYAAIFSRAVFWS